MLRASRGKYGEVGEKVGVHSTKYWAQNYSSFTQHEGDCFATESLLCTATRLVVQDMATQRNFLYIGDRGKCNELLIIYCIFFVFVICGGCPPGADSAEGGFSQRQGRGPNS